MFRLYFLHRVAQRLPTFGMLIAVFLIVTGCATRSPLPPPEGSLATSDTEFIPVTRYGRYTLVELSPTAVQQDLLLQVVDVSIPDTLNASVSDGLRHVLQRSGYQLCDGLEADSFSTLPLPAPHYHLGPLMLRDALQTLVGSGWNLYTDQQARQVCFIQSITTPDFPSIDLDFSLDIPEEVKP